MAKTDLKINATDGYGNDISTTISYVNPDAGKNDILAVTQAMNALTTNTYKETQRIQTVNVDLETVPSTPTITSSVTQYTLSEFTGTGTTKTGPASIITYNGDGDITFDRAAINAGFIFSVQKGGAGFVVDPSYQTTSVPSGITSLKIGFSETANYKACSVEITVTA